MPQPDPEPRLVSAAFVDRFLVAAFGIGLAIRVGIAVLSPIKPSSPVLWAAAGLAQDLFLFSAAAIPVLALSAAPLATIGRFLLAAGLLVESVVHLGWAQAILYFGHAPRRDDLALAASGDVVKRSADARSLVEIALLAGGAALFLYTAARRARRARRARSSVTRCLAIAAASFGCAFLLRNVSAADTTASPVVALTRLLGERVEKDPEGRLVVPPARLPEPSVRLLAPHVAPAAWRDGAYPLVHERERSAAAPRVPAGLRPNVVFVVMEGVRAHELGAWGGRVEGVSPNLDRLAAEGVLVEDAYSPGTKTPEGEMALWYGLLAMPHEIVMTYRPDLRLVGLPELLRAAGWQAFFWIYGGDQTFYRRERFYKARGFRMADGRDFGPDDPWTNWGRSDRSLAERAVVGLDRLKEPFAALVLTISNHHPFQVPSDSRHPLDVHAPEQRGWVNVPGISVLMGRHTIPMIKTIHYTDEAVGLLVEEARRRAWSERTVFVICGDHGLPILPLEGTPTRHQLETLRHHVPLLIWAPFLRHARVTSPALLSDVPETLLGLFGLPGPAGGLGRDLLDPASERPDRPAVCWDSEARIVSVFTRDFAYHGALPADAMWNPASLAEEILVDRKRDPDGRRDASADRPEELRRLRAAALTYLDVYPWLVASDRSGIPPKT
jgi:arylsulfatase A-like enzyme